LFFIGKTATTQYLVSAATVTGFFWAGEYQCILQTRPGLSGKIVREGEFKIDRNSILCPWAQSLG
jgi:hypothetical protein